MIRPSRFVFNAETAVNNAFQTRQPDEAVPQKALAEFNNFVDLLKTNGVDVVVVDDTPEPFTPDSIFPNNWISFHEDGTLLLYPMFAENRRKERKLTVLDTIKKRFTIHETIDLSFYEKEQLFLEGTGSMVLDRDSRIAYACSSPRTDEIVFKEFCELLNYQPVLFHAVDSGKQAIYHTNVLMCVADRYVVICLDAIPDQQERRTVTEAIQETRKLIIPISLDQMNHFAGNMLQVQDGEGRHLLVMSSQAYHSLLPEQREQLISYNPIVHAELSTIETNGGGSARCMMAEIHLPQK